MKQFKAQKQARQYKISQTQKTDRRNAPALPKIRWLLEQLNKKKKSALRLKQLRTYISKQYGSAVLKISC